MRAAGFRRPILFPPFSHACRAGFFRVSLFLLATAFAYGQEDGPRASDPAVSESQAAGFRPLRLNSGHGLAFGQGRKTENGYHLADSLSLSLRQPLAGGRLSEEADADVNTALQKGTVQSSDAGGSVRYKRGGFSLGGEIGIAYAATLFNKLSRTEKVRAKASTDLHFGASLSQAFTLDADSSWQVSAGAGYDDLGGTFRTLSGNSNLTKDIGDFELALEASGYRQAQRQTVSTCAGKGGKAGKTCTDSTSLANVTGAGAALRGDWDPGKHLLSLRAGWDLEFTQPIQRILSLGLGYAYSPWSWLDVGGYAEREIDLDVKTGARFWAAGASISVGL